MDVTVKKWKKLRKESSSSSVDLYFEICTKLTPEERKLVKKYYDPVVAIRSKEIRGFLSEYRLAMELSEKIRDSIINRVDKNFQLGGWDNMYEFRDKLRSLIQWSDSYPLEIYEKENSDYLSNYKFSACVYDGIRHLYEAEQIINAINNKLKSALNYLKFLDDWAGEETIIIEADGNPSNINFSYADDQPPHNGDRQ